MHTDVSLPELGEDAGKEATISFWYVEEGGSVEKGQDLVEMVTDKATFNVPAPATGVLRQIKAVEGDKVEVGQLMAVIESEG
ncbi:MAG: lipoyl domain-containing protein [Planctomycetota bacterium]|jgi:pyruvate dehydrogenase E2 component (dihydrolipoamide acetyltransferase)